MKIAIISDSHDNRRLLKKSTLVAKERGAKALLHCGDIVAPSTLLEAREANIPVHAIHGNNTGDLVMMNHIANRPDSIIKYYGQDAEIELHQKRIFIVHYPHYARAMAITGSYDMVCCGHDHKYNCEWIENIKGGKTLLANPGSVGGLDGPASFILADLGTMETEQVILD